MERIRLLDRVQQQFPRDDELAEWLTLALMEAALDDEAAKVLRASIKGQQGPVLCGCGACSTRGCRATWAATRC